MSILLGTLVLNEMQWLPALYEQHRNWPGLSRWVFVESADRVYAQANPELVSDKGLSVDGTSEYLANLALSDPRVTYIPLGFSEHRDAAQGKAASRQQYLDVANEDRPDFVFVVDADEFYTVAHQRQITETLRRSLVHFTAFMFRQRHVWRPPSIAEEPLFQYEVTRAYWDIPHCRGWRWKPGMAYANDHNTPSVGGRKLNASMLRFEGNDKAPQCVHLGFASSGALRHAKHSYYVARGEGRSDGRQMYVDCRAAFETWQPGQILPHGADVRTYKGPIPEVFHHDTN